MNNLSKLRFLELNRKIKLEELQNIEKEMEELKEKMSSEQPSNEPENIMTTKVKFTEKEFI